MRGCAASSGVGVPAHGGAPPTETTKKRRKNHSVCPAIEAAAAPVPAFCISLNYRFAK